MITFLRRKALGANSIRGMSAYLDSCEVSTVGVRTWTGSTISVIRNDMPATRSDTILDSTSLLIRWGCTSPTGVSTSKQLNTSESIKLVGNKLKFRELVSQVNSPLCPKTIFSTCPRHNTQHTDPLVLRPARHSQGKNLFVCNGVDEVLNVVHQRPTLFREGWYASELIDKVAEYRVYVVSGRVATVAQKTPDDPTQVAWNVAQGGRFDVVRWGEWPMEAVKVSLEAFNLSGLDFGGVDVMVDREGRAYVIEINSAPSLPLLSSGAISYRQKCMVKCFKYILDNGKQHFSDPEGYDHWSQVIHPAIQG